MGGKGGGKAPAPDPQIGKAALLQAETGQDWLDFARDQFQIGNVRQQDIDALSKRVTEQQLATQDQANQWAKEDRTRYTDVYRPLEDQYIEQAKTWDSADRQAQVAAEARADVQSAADMQRQTTNRQMAAMGVNPNSGRFAGTQRAGETATALASAGAANSARDRVQQQGMAMRADAINMGKGLPSQAAGAAGLGLTAGSSALGNQLNANNSWRSNVGIMGQGFGGAMQGYAGQASTLNQQYGNQLAGWQAQQNASGANAAGLMSGIGSLAGLGIMAFSSKDLKENKEPVEGALDAVNSMPVEAWDYKEGVADEGRHIGPYAEDFQSATGMGDGKTINLVDGMGLTMKAVQELDHKIEKLARGIEVTSKKRNPPKQRAQA
ncbi:hypothetical protein D3C76_48150 [compost metagenome]